MMSQTCGADPQVACECVEIIVLEAVVVCNGKAFLAMLCATDAVALASPYHDSERSDWPSAKVMRELKRGRDGMRVE